MLNSFSHVCLFVTPLTMDFPGKNTGVGSHALLGSSWPRDQTCISWVSCIGRWVLYHWSTRETQTISKTKINKCYVRGGVMGARLRMRGSSKFHGRDTETACWRIEREMSKQRWGSRVPDRGNSKAERKWLRWGLRARDSPHYAGPDGQEQDFFVFWIHS